MVLAFDASTKALSTSKIRATKFLDIGPGDAWRESGMETVVALHSLQFPAIFIRGLLLPIELEGTVSNIWITDETPSQSNWDLLYEQKITL